MLSKTKILNTITIVFEVILSLTIIVFYYLNIKVESQSNLYVPNGTIRSIVTQLHQKGVAINNLDIYIISILGKPQSGWIDIGETILSKGDFLYKLVSAKSTLKKITIIPGESAYFALKNISSQLDLNFEKLFFIYQNSINYEDGILIPQTYMVSANINEKDLIEYLISFSKNYYKTLSRAIFDTFNEEKWFQIVTIASIIQKEAADISEMPLIASVIYNRLRANMPLQMDGTLNYKEYSHRKITPEIIKNDTTSYNTYKNRGLPKNPISTVSKEAIYAALNPQKSSYFYFVKGSDNKHIFSKSYNAHLKNIYSVK